MGIYRVSYEYSNSNSWNTDVGQPSQHGKITDAVNSAIKYLSGPTANAETRVRIRTAERPGLVREITDYGYFDSGWVND
jgi:hypothetical protein